MRAAATAFVVLVAVEHVWFLVLEMFLWRKPFGLRTFGTTPEFAEASAPLAANQGLYNGILAAGLVASLIEPSPIADAGKMFFLAAVAVAGFYGGVTVKRSLFALQMAPALVALLLVRIAG